MVEYDMIEAIRLHPLFPGMRHARQMPVEQQHMAKPPAGDERMKRSVQPLDIGTLRIKLAVTGEAGLRIHALAGKSDGFLHLGVPAPVAVPSTGGRTD